MVFTLQPVPRIPGDAEIRELHPWASTYDATTHVSEMHGADHQTATDCITLEEFHQLRAEGKA